MVNGAGDALSQRRRPSGSVYGVTWNTLRRNIFNWKHRAGWQPRSQGEKYCTIPHVLKLLKDYIVFAEQEEELRDLSCASVRTVGVEKVIQRALNPELTRGLIGTRREAARALR